MVVLENKWIHVEINTWHGAFVEILNRPANLHLVSEKFKPDSPPWILRMKENLSAPPRQTSSFESCDVMPRTNGKDVDFTWKIKEGLSIKATASLPKDSPELTLVFRVENKTKEIISSLEFPLISGIGILGNELNNTYLAHPVARGFLFRAPFKTLADPGLLRHVPYPSGSGSTMQFFAYYLKDAGGFYFICRDPKNTAKEFNFFRDAGALAASIMHESWDLKPGNALDPGYPVIIGVLNEGDWREAADRYRAWAAGAEKDSPAWCNEGKLEDRVKKGTAAKWLAEQTGFCTFGMPSSLDVSKWIEAFHGVASTPVFHVLGYDWAGWSRLERGPLPGLREILGKIGLKPGYATLIRMHAELKNFAPHDVTDETRLKNAMKEIGVDISASRIEDLREAFRLYQRFRPEFEDISDPAQWFPSNMDPKNSEAVKKNGDRFALFLFDFLSYGHNLDRYGLLSRELRENLASEFLDNWMHPSSKYWQDFHALRDAEAVKQCGVDANYYDLSASSLGNFSDRTDLGCPAGKGRNLIEAYRRVYSASKEATMKAARACVPRGTEAIAENFINVIDFAHCRSGAEVQNDMEGTQFLQLLKNGFARRIPMWPYVYHEFGPVCMDGLCKLSKDFGNYFYYIASRVCLEGSIVELNYEYSSPELLPEMSGKSVYITHDRTFIEDENPFQADPEKLEFLREIAAARTGFAKPYLAYGKMARPAKLISEVEYVEMDWYHYSGSASRRDSGTQTVPAVIHEAWTHQDKTMGLLFVNLYGKSQIVIVDLDLRKYAIPRGPWKLSLVSSNKEPAHLGEMAEPIGRIRFTLEPRKIYLLEITGHKA